MTALRVDIADVPVTSTGRVDILVSYVQQLLRAEAARRDDNLTLIASEWSMPADVRLALSTVFAEKYFEGTPLDCSLDRLLKAGLVTHDLVRLKRPGWYAPGCDVYDDLSWLCQAAALDLFDPGGEARYYLDNRVLSGSQANQSVFLAVTKLKKKRQLKVMCLSPDHGGHLSHGLSSNVAGIMHDVSYYGVGDVTGTVDYDALREQIAEQKPDLLIYGGSACPRDWDHRRMLDVVSISQETYVLYDGAHPAGLVASGLNASPFAAGVHFITMTTNKTLCGPRGAFVAGLAHLAEVLARSVFPGLTAGPHGHEIYAKLLCYCHARTEQFRKLMLAVRANADALARRLSDDNGLKLVTDGTDTHLLLVDLRGECKRSGITGWMVECWAAEAGIYLNRNAVPNDAQPHPSCTSGVRLGVGSLTQRGMGPEQMRIIGDVVASLIRDGRSQEVRARTRSVVSELVQEYPLLPLYR